MFRPVMISILSVCVVFVSWLYFSSVENQRAVSSGQVRQSMVQRQHAEQRLIRLNEAHTGPFLRVLGEAVSAVQIRVAEYLTMHNTENPQSRFTYEQSLLAQHLPTDSLENTTDSIIKSVRILRLDMQLQLAHAQAFLMLLRDINGEVGGWPLEVRACDLQKTPMRKLNVRCIVDIYHWSEGTDEHVE